MDTFLKIALTVIVSTLTLAGCVTARVSGERIVVLNERITSLGICVQNRFFTKVKDTPGEATAISVGNRQLGELYPKLVERLSLFFARADVQSTTAMCETAGTTVPPELNSYSQILRISPGKSEFVGSSYSLWLNAEIFQRYGGRIIWRGEIGWSSTGMAKVSNELADGVVQKLLNQLQEDEVIPNLKKILTSKASSKPPVLNHSSNVPAATSFAAVDDVNAVPNLSQSGKELYLEWLKRPSPRAAALSDAGGIAWGYGADAMRQAIQSCEKVTNKTCRLYAVDDQVVWTATVHADPVPPSTKYAPVDDVNAVPKIALGPQGKEYYLEWLTKPFPRAFAISEKGGFARAYGANAMQQAIQNCEKVSKNPCHLYAVDDQVVWVASNSSPANRIPATAIAIHAESIPPSTGFAPLNDVNAVPKLSPKGKELYLEWLTKPFPRAVAVSDKGAMARGYGANAMQQAVQNCEKLWGSPCRLYAVDDRVVWKAE